MSGVVAVLICDRDTPAIVDLVVYHRRLTIESQHRIDTIVDGPDAAATAGRPSASSTAAVEWSSRDLDRTHALARRALAGQARFELDPGRARMVPDFQPVAELATGRLIADPSGEVLLLKRRLQRYPRPLAVAIMSRLWQTGPLIAEAHRAADRGDTAAVAAALSRAVEMGAHALHARAGRWPPDQSDLLYAAQQLPGTPAGFAERSQQILARLGRRPHHLHTATTAVEALLAAVIERCSPS